MLVFSWFQQQKHIVWFPTVWTSCFVGFCLLSRKWGGLLSQNNQSMLLSNGQSTVQSKEEQDQEHSKLMLLTLFTTFPCKENKLFLYQNTLKNQHLNKTYFYKIVFFSDAVCKNLWKDITVHNGWMIIDAPKTSPSGIPVLSSMYQHVISLFNSKFYAYFNADVIFDASIAHTLTSLRTYSLESVLIIGRRCNYDIHFGEEMFTHQQIKHAKLKCKMFNHWAIDYFVFTHNVFNWTLFPELVIGKGAFPVETKFLLIRKACLWASFLSLFSYMGRADRI